MTPRDFKIIGLVVLIFGIYLIVLLWNIWPIQEISISKSGVFGDSFGALTALFSGLAFAGLLVTIFNQREDLGLTKEELRLTREDIKAQHLDTTFFHMLKLQQDIVAGIDLHRSINGNERETKGRDCFKVFSRRIRRAYERLKPNHSTGEQQVIADAYNQIWLKSQSDLGHYFRSLYNLFKYLSENNFSDKKQFGRIARAQLSDYELVVLFYNCVNTKGSSFIRYAKEFEIFDNLDIALLIKKEHVKLLPIKVYGENQPALSIHAGEIPQ
ncbi:hypothetical protein O59_003239 [Cellvibrio sp. BR]|uniref:putative phage abortive infection protein n=1 Tax=Cellvibrio sp. BR TaxID=1134474 RepID=UPI00026017BC|nr:putative phage abortive infection protein [Cellvibrio sp. BR]EIK44158.1 hypothetical protein O59_003239 [Cellvibrio sp. BR]